MAKKSTRGSTSRRRKATKPRDLPAVPKARTVKGGAFSSRLSAPGNRVTIK